MGVSLCLPRISRAEAPARIVKVSRDGFHAKVKSKLTQLLCFWTGFNPIQIMIGIVLLNN